MSHSSDDQAGPVASIVLATWNRKDDLRKAIQSSMNQTVPVEVIVLDDGSTDGTPEMVRNEFPQVRVYQEGQKLGPNRNRHRGIELATTPFVFPIDDDAEFTSPHTVEQTLRDFEEPRAGAVAIPYLEVLDDEVLQSPPDASRVYITPRYVGCCVAMRRDVFLAAGGYTASQFNAGEESDLCLRMLNLGYVTRLGTADRMAHHRSPVRNTQSNDHRIRRNAITRAWQNVPALLLLPTWGALSAMYLLKAPERFGRWATLKALMDGLGTSFKQFRNRRPVSHGAYRAWLKFRKSDPITFGTPPLALDDFARNLPARRTLASPPPAK